jgi:hypothetical protein
MESIFNLFNKLYIKFHNRGCAEIAELGKGDGFRVHFRRDSWVQIPLSASRVYNVMNLMGDNWAGEYYRA